MDPTLFRELMAGICGPVTIVTTLHDGAPHGTTVSAMMSVSLSPPLVVVCLDKASAILAHARAAQRFAINVLGANHADLALRFAKKLSGPEKFEGVAWSTEEGLPRIEGAPGWMVCALDQAVEAGDHVLMIGRLTSGSATRAAPLVYAHRQFGTHSAFIDSAASAASDSAKTK